MAPTWQSIIPKLPMTDLTKTQQFYTGYLGFTVAGVYDDYLIMQKDTVEIHYFLFPELNPKENYGMIYIRVNGIDELYENLRKTAIKIPELGKLQTKPWGQREFSIVDTDYNLLTFGQMVSKSK